MKNVQLIALSLFFAGMSGLFSSCEPAPETIVAEVTPLELVLFDTDTISNISFSTKPEVSLEYSVSHHPSWLIVVPAKGTIEPGTDQLKVRLNSRALKKGSFRDSITIVTSKAGKISIPVILSLSGLPKIRLNHSELNFDASTNRLTLSIDNSGTGILEWSLLQVPEWMYAVPNTFRGSVAEGKMYSFVLYCKKELLTPGQLDTSLEFITNTTTPKINVPVHVEVPELYQLKFSQESVVYSYSDTQKQLYLRNTGNSTIHWDGSSAEYLQLSPGSGTLQKGDSTLIKIELVNRAAFNTGQYLSTITINGTNSKVTLPVRIDNYVNTQWILPYKPTAARYSKNTNKIIAYTAENLLLSIDPDSKTVQTLQLGSTAQCMAVDTKGAYAAVGHNGSISVVDLSTMTLKKNIATQWNVEHLALASDGWLYYFDFSSIRAVHINNGSTFTNGTSMYAYGPMELHPSENYIYAYPRFTSGSFYKFSVNKGVVKELYYKGRLSTFWISSSGERMYTPFWEVFLLSEIELEDLTYSQNFSDVKNEIILALSDSKARNKTLVLPMNQPVTVREYDYTYLNFQKSYAVEHFMVGTPSPQAKLYQGEGKYLFYNDDKNEGYVLLRAPATAGISNDWALQPIYMNK